MNLSDYELVAEWKRLQAVRPDGVDLDRNGPHVIALIQFTLFNIGRLTALAELGVTRSAN